LSFIVYLLIVVGRPTAPNLVPNLVVMTQQPLLSLLQVMLSLLQLLLLLSSSSRIVATQNNATTHPTQHYCTWYLVTLAVAGW